MPSPTTIVLGVKANFGISDCGQVMAEVTKSALASVEPEGVYEHLAIGNLREGYTIAYKDSTGNDTICFDVFETSKSINCVSNKICRNDKTELVKVTESVTTDGLISIRQTFIVPKNSTRVLIRMEIRNCATNLSLDKANLSDLLIKRYADIDVDTGGNAGWASFLGRWDKDRYSVFNYNLDSDAPTGKRSHIVNMVAMPSDLPLDGTFVCRFGDHFAVRENLDQVTTLPSDRIDANGILQWKASRFLPGEIFIINMYYDTYRSFALDKEIIIG
ncbi:MAG: hypothetical protein JNN15_05745 [Blastocatellia bacterium]|nr:hypothetical protein [Blastocatellia bacterium]